MLSQLTKICHVTRVKWAVFKIALNKIEFFGLVSSHIIILFGKFSWCFSYFSYVFCLTVTGFISYLVFYNQRRLSVLVMMFSPGLLIVDGSSYVCIYTVIHHRHILLNLYNLLPCSIDCSFICHFFLSKLLSKYVLIEMLATEVHLCAVI